jgi:hypothetical protein
MARSEWGPKSESNPGLRGLLGGSGIGRHAFAEEWMTFRRLRAGQDRLAVASPPLEEPQEIPRELPERSQEWTPRPRVLGKASKGYTRSDERIREDIWERLINSPYDASEVEVFVARGEVTLIGTVLHRADQWGIVDVVETVPGVQDVHNEIRLETGTHPGDTGHLHS